MNELLSHNHGAADERYTQLSAWVAERIPGFVGSGAGDIVWALQGINSDAGFRRYYRLVWQGQEPRLPGMLAVDAPPASEDTEQFVALARYLRRQGVRTPAVYAVDVANGFLLVEDFGDDLLQTRLAPDTAAPLYGEAFMSLLALQQCPDDSELLPRYDQTLLREELDLFGEWFIERLLNHRLTPDEQGLLEQTFIKLEHSALEQPQVLVHRDFHSRNLLVCPQGGLGVIDFQSAVWGACTYDPVSILRDCYVKWPAEDVRRWALGYGNMAMDVGILPRVDEDTFMRWFDWMGLQRHIKVLGIFARLHLRDHKSAYLRDLPRVMNYLQEVVINYPDLADFADWFEHTIKPLASLQTWYVPILSNEVGSR